MTGSRMLPRYRPSQIIHLTEGEPRWGPPTSRPAAPATTSARRLEARRAAQFMLVILLLVMATTVGLSTVTDHSQAGPNQPVMVTDIATENAVASVLRVFSAEADLIDAALGQGDVFALPGAQARARSLTHLVGRLEETLAMEREADLAAGTPGSLYVLDPTHDALAQYAHQVAADAALLGFLGDIHTSIYGGASVLTLSEARQRLAEEVVPLGRPSAAMQWAVLLVNGIDAGDRGGSPGEQPAEAARVAAAGEWAAEAQRLQPAAGQLLVEFLGGIDPGVIASLEGHPEAGPALARLRS